MSDTQQLRMLIDHRLNAAAEEIFGFVERTMTKYEDQVHLLNLEIDRQRKILAIALNPQIKLLQAEPKQCTLSLCNEEVPEQHHSEQERSPNVDQEDPQPPQIKEEPEVEQQLLWLEEEKDTKDSKNTESSAVDEHDVPGINHVDNLADYLVGLRPQTSLTLSDQQVSTITALWENLDPSDRKRITFASRYQEGQKEADFSPGVESSTSCVLDSPPKLPDCCHLVETIFMKLSKIHKGPQTSSQGDMTRRTLMLRDYMHIRQLVTGNVPLTQATSLQLVKVSQNTLSQWHNRILERQDTTMYLPAPAPLPMAAEPLQDCTIRPAKPTHHEEEHVYNLPESTNLKRKATTLAVKPVAVRPKLVAHRQLFPQTGGQFNVVCQATPVYVTAGTFLPATPNLRPLASSPYPTIGSVQLGVPPAAAKTKLCRKRYVKNNSCHKCGQYRISQTGHSQYKGYIYCPRSETLTKDQWLHHMKGSSLWEK